MSERTMEPARDAAADVAAADVAAADNAVVDNAAVANAPVSQPAAGDLPPMALVAPWYPALSETFVRREAAELRRRGADMCVVSLREPGEQDITLTGESPDAIVYRGAASTFAAAAAEGLRHPWRSLGTLCMSLADALNPGEPTSPGARARFVVQALGAIGLAPRLRARGVQHLHAHFAHASAGVAMYTARQLGVPFSFVGHANDIFERRQLLARKLRRAAFVSCISHWHRELYQSIHARPESEYPVVRCGVDVSQWSSTGAAGESPAASPAGSPDDAVPGEPSSAAIAPVRLLGVGRIVAKKGFDRLIDALPRLPEGLSPWTLTIIGDGPAFDDLAAQVAASGLAGRITLAGAQPEAVVTEAMQSADVFVLPCRVDGQGDRDGIPVVLMEAMACELPVIVGDLPAIRELVHAPDVGRLVPAKDDDALVAALAEIIGNADARAAIGRAARAWIEAEFEVQVNGDRVGQAIVAAGHASRGSRP
ncbi:MAG: glycosyltransferase family 4 protein [Phycisphaerales bacterium]